MASQTARAMAAAPRAGRGGQEGGFALLELAVAVALASMMLIWAANRLVHQADDAAARAAGVWLLELKRGLDNMLRQHYDSLAEGVPALDEAGRPLYADLLAPRLAELKARGHLPAGFPETSTLGGAVAIRILRGSYCPGAGCRLDALAYGTQPVLVADGSAPDLMKIGAAVEAAGGYGGAATATRVRGANFDFANPLAADMAPLPPGTLAAWAGVGMAEHDLFVRRRDPRDPDLQGSLTVAGTLSTGARLHTGEYLSLGGVAAAGTPCPADPPGLLARSADGALLGCRGGLWTAAEGGFGGAYASNNRYGCRHYSGVSTANPRTGKCSCPAGYTKVIVSAGGKWTEKEGWTTGYVCVR